MLRKLFSYLKFRRMAFLLLVGLALNGALFAQVPWNAKIMFHSHNGYVDTLWIGCDVNGGAGYQENLDLIDTNYVSKGGIWGYDPAIEFGECFNLKKDIKNFITGIQTFRIQIADTTFNQSTEYDFFSIDTNDFKFDNGTYKITSLYIELFDGYVLFIDLTHLYLYDNYTPDFPPTFFYDSVSLIFEPDLFDWLPVNDYQVRMNMEVGFNYYPLGTGIDDLEGYQPSIYPNPVNDILHVKSDRSFSGLSVQDIMGNTMYSDNFENAVNKYDLNVQNWMPGIYILLIEPMNEVSKIIGIKFIIL